MSSGQENTAPACAALPVLYLLNDLVFDLDGRCRREPASGLHAVIGNLLELPGDDTRLEAGAYVHLNHLLPRQFSGAGGHCRGAPRSAFSAARA